MKSTKSSIVLALCAVIIGCQSQRPATPNTDKKVPSTSPKSGENSLDLGSERDGSLSLKPNSTNVLSVGSPDVTESDIGLPFIEGAIVRKQGTFKLEIGEDSSANVVLETSKSIEEVEAFYKDKLVDKSQVSTDTTTESRKVISGQLLDGRTISITLTRPKQGDVTEVMLTSVRSGAAVKP
jgi:hypothetical protein